MKPEWEQLLATWLGGGVDLELGAELEVTNRADGSLAFKAPLARHYRIDEGVLWIRPIVGGYPIGPEIHDRGDPDYAFSLDACRVRALTLSDVEVLDGEIVIQHSEYQLARIREAGSETMPELERWDTFFFTVLDAQEEAALDEVWGDSWHGKWA
jgi:hypothetical protein